MTHADSLAFIPDDELFAAVQRLTARSNVALADLLAHLGEVERRGVHRARACASLYTYCIYELRMSEDAAFRRSKAARFVREYPELHAAIAKGEIHLTGVLMIGPHLGGERHAEILKRARFRSKRELARLVAEIDPQPEVPALVEPIGPEPSAVATHHAFVEALAGPVRDLSLGRRPEDWMEMNEDDANRSDGRSPEPTDVTESPRPMRYKVQFTATQEFVDLLDEARDLLGPETPRPTLLDIQLRALRSLVKELRGRKRGATERTRVPHAPSRRDAESETSGAAPEGPGSGFVAGQCYDSEVPQGRVGPGGSWRKRAAASVCALALTTSCSNDLAPPESRCDGCVTLATVPPSIPFGQQPRPVSMAIDGANVYWTVESWSGLARHDESIMKVPVAGGDATVLTPTQEPHAIAVDGTSVYWLDAEGLMKISADGGEAKQLADAHADAEGWTSITVDATNAYWFDDGGLDLSTGYSVGRCVMSVPFDGGTPAILVGDDQGPIAGVAVDGTSIYWQSYNHGLDIMKTPLPGIQPSGGGKAALASGLVEVNGLVVDATSVYWGGTDAIMKVSLDGGSPTKLTPTVGRFAIDETNVYWARMQTDTNNSHSGSIFKAPLAGGATTTLATGEDSPVAIAVDDANLYWVNRGSGEIRKQPK